MKDVEAIVEVLSKRPGGDRFLEIGAGGRDQSSVGLHRVCPAQTLELTLLQDSEQLHLDRGIDIADLVEKERAPGGQLETPLLARGWRR